MGSLLRLLPCALTLVASCAACDDHDCRAAPQLLEDRSIGTEPSGVEHCQSHRWHRASGDVACAPAWTVICAASACRCGAGESCVHTGSRCECAVLCTRDEECGEGALCACSAGVLRVIGDGFIGAGTAVVDRLVDRPTCLPADCRTDDDCEQGRCMGDFSGFHCESDADECQLAEDCWSLEQKVCSYREAVGHRVCADPIPFG